MASQSFEFPKDLFDFLNDLSANNRREWFMENKPRYETSVVAPVTQFIVAIGQELTHISPYFAADPRPHRGSMFRINRDTRFAKDKRPYKENVGCHFRHTTGRSAHALGFYLHLQPGNSFAGGGIWKPSPADLDKIRSAIVERADAWGEVLANETLSKRYGGIEGERLKNVPKGYPTDTAYPDDLKKKSYFLKQEFDDQGITSPGIVEAIAQAYRDAAPLMKFLADALELPY